MGNNLYVYLAQIVIVLGLILGAICPKANGIWNNNQPTTSVQMSYSRPPTSVSAADLWQHLYMKTYPTDLVNHYSYTTQAFQPVTSSSFEMQPSPPKQVRFTSQDAVDIRRQDFDLSNEHHNQQLIYQQMPQQFQPPSESSLESRELNVNGRIRSQLTFASGVSRMPVSFWRPVASNVQRQTPPVPTTHLREPTMTLPVRPGDGMQQRGGRDEFEVQNFKTNRSIETDNRCRSRGLGSLYAGAKNLVTGAFEQYATPGNLMFGSGLLAAVVPLAALVLPESRKRRADDEDERPGNLPATKYSLQGRVDSVMGWIERSVEHLPHFPRLHPQECVKRSICEAHNEPNKYGAIGFVLRLFFPATNLSVTDRMDDMEYKVINKYRHAAGYGLNKRLDNNGTSSAACREKYEDCLISLLDVAQNLIDIFLK